MTTLIDQRKQISDELAAADLSGVSLTTRVAIERACALLNEIEQQQSDGVSFGFGDRSTIVSQEAYSIFLEREKAARTEPTGRCMIEVVNGPEGPSLYIGYESSGHRLAGPKPWGGGRTVFKFDVAIAELIREAKAIAEEPAE